MSQAKYKRVIIKISGEALSGAKGSGFDHDYIDKVVDQLIEARKLGVEIGIVVGGGNFWRGRQGGEMERSQADHIGMLATVMNALALQGQNNLAFQGSMLNGAKKIALATMMAIMVASPIVTTTSCVKMEQEMTAEFDEALIQRLIDAMNAGDEKQNEILRFIDFTKDQL